jgi:hypothetical protein
MSQVSGPVKSHALSTAISSKCSNQRLHYKPWAKWFLGVCSDCERNPEISLQLFLHGLTQHTAAVQRSVWDGFEAESVLTERFFFIPWILEAPHFLWAGLSVHTLWARAKTSLAPGLLLNMVSWSVSNRDNRVISFRNKKKMFIIWEMKSLHEKSHTQKSVD